MTLDREKTLAAAQQAAEQNQFERALGEYRKLLAVDPNDARVLLKVGDLQMRAQDFAGAIATYDRVARFYADQGFALKAVAVYKQVRELLLNHRPDLQPNFSHVLAQLVQLYVSLGLPNDALQTLDEEANRQRRANQEEGAVQVYRQMTALSPGSPLPHLRLAEGLCRIGRVDEALTSFWTASQLLLQADRKDEALRVIERMLHFKSEPRYALAAARLYLSKGTSPEGMQALSRLQVCFQADPTNLEVLGLLADAFAVIGQTDKATEVQKEIARQAHEQGDTELFERTLQALKNNAPDDEQVAALTQLPPPRATSHPGAHSRSGHLGAPPPKPRTSSPPSLEPVSLVPESLDVVSVFPPTPVPSPPPAAVPSAPVAVPSTPLASPLPSYVPGLPPAFLQPPSPASQSKHHGSVPPPPPLSSHAVEAPPSVPSAAPPSRSKPAKVPSAPYQSQPASISQPSLPPLPSPAGASAGPESVPDRLSRLGRDIEATTHSTAPPAVRGALRSEIDVDDLDDLDFADEDSFTQGPLSDAVPRPAQMRPTAPSAVDVQSNTRQTLILVQQHRQQGQIDRALEALHNALELHPRSIELRETLRDLHAERGDREAAIEEMLTMAAIYLEYGRADHASTVLRNILEAEPTHPRARAALDGIVAMASPANRSSLAPRGSMVPQPAARPAAASPQVHDAFLAASVEEALEESEFFSSRGMFGDARRVLVDQMAQTPNHPLLIEALSELDKQTPKRRPTSKPAAPAKRPSDFNVKEHLSELERVVRESQQPPSASNGPLSIDVDAVFEKFKAGVRSQVADTDSSTHYDLGLAYKEMNLLSDAIEELKLAARDPDRECTCYAMIGLIYAEQKEWDQARKFYSKGLGAMKRTPMQDATIYYELGHVSEMAEQLDQAAYYFRQVLRRDPAFRDARDRLSRLRTSWAPPAETRGSPDEEVDRAFDELMNDG